ncbi:MAG: HEAT repeat domain-containing protein [Methanomicrobiaceae archaeon]|nr:HEAT repeat domain-containing protein [Methanomicrobiaceae archaeon]MDD5418615.1 HEAT repeat domain-containing protein [Methanomicrobiaceae archaeon]
MRYTREDTMIAKMETPKPMRRDVYDLIGELGGMQPQERRIRAMQDLEALGDPRAVSVLIETLRDADPEIRKHSAKALIAFRSVRSVDALIETLMNGDEWWITRRYAALALGRIQGYRATAALARYQNEAVPGGRAAPEEARTP